MERKTMKEKLIELLEQFAVVSDELIELDNAIKEISNQIGEDNATQIVAEWLSQDLVDA
jgi:hypothetical protein